MKLCSVDTPNSQSKGFKFDAHFSLHFLRAYYVKIYHIQFLAFLRFVKEEFVLSICVVLQYI